MILKEICSVIDFQFIVFLSTHESFFPTTIRQWSWTSGGVFPLKLRQSGLCYLNIEYLRLHHRRIHDYDVNFFKLRKNFQTQIWDPGVHIYRFANGGIRRLRTDQIKGSRFMFVLTIEILVLHLAKTSTSFSIDGDIFLLSPIVSFGLRETLLGFKTRINRRLDEPVSLPQSSQEELNLVIQRGLWLFVDWMITIHRWPPNIQDEVLKLIPIWIKEWRIHDEYLREHIIGVIEKANQAIEDYSFISNFDQHVIEVHDLVAEKLHHIKATYSNGHFIESAIIVVLWYRESFGINKRKIQEKEILLSPRFAIEHGDGGVISKMVTISCDGKALFGLEEGETKFRSNLITKIPIQRNKKRWDLLTVRQVPRGLRERFICGDLHQSTGFKALKICLLNGQMRILESSIVTKKETMVINEQRCIRRFKTHGQEPFQTTYHNFLSIKVMRKAFRSFIYMMIACYECMKRGLNRFFLLPVRLLLESRVTSTSSSKLGFNFLYLFQWLYLNGFMYHVSCKTFME